MEAQLLPVEQAILFATAAHAGATRRDGRTPYILHCTETAAIAAGMTDKQEVLAAAVLHDVLEDTPTSYQALEVQFGSRVANLVQSMSENKRSELPPESTWLVRKEETIAAIMQSEDSDLLILSLADKLSNLRGIYHDYLISGDDIWESFHQKSRQKQAWYYFRLEEALRPLSGTAAWQELHQLRCRLFER